MKKAKLITSLSLLPVVTIAPVFLSSCSNATSKFTDLKYEDDYELLGGDRDAAIAVASRHLPMVNTQKTITYGDFLTYLHTQESVVEIDQPVKQMDPTIFYWEFLYPVATTGNFCKVKNWNVDIEKDEYNYPNYKISFDYQWGRTSSTGSQISWEDWMYVKKLALPCYGVDKDGKVNYYYRETRGEGESAEVVNRVNPSFSFQLVDVKQDSAIHFQKWNATDNKWDNTTDTIEITTNQTTGYYMGIALDEEYRCDNQCEFSIGGTDAAKFGFAENSWNKYYGIFGWSNLTPGEYNITLTATYKPGSDPDKMNEESTATIPVKVTVTSA